MSLFNLTEKENIFILTLHLNYVIKWFMVPFHRPLRTLPFEIFFSLLHIRESKTYPWTYFGHFLSTSLYDDPVPF